MRARLLIAAVLVWALFAPGTVDAQPPRAVGGSHEIVVPPARIELAAETPALVAAGTIELTVELVNEGDTPLALNTTITASAPSGSQLELLRFDETIPADTRRTVRTDVAIDEVGPYRIEADLAPSSPWASSPLDLMGLLPIEATLIAPGSIDEVVVGPEVPARITLELRSVSNATLHDVAVVLGEPSRGAVASASTLEPGATTTLTLVVDHARWVGPSGRDRGISTFQVPMTLSATYEGQATEHPLFLTGEASRTGPVMATVLALREPVLLARPFSGELGASGQLEAALLNPSAEPVSRELTVRVQHELIEGLTEAWDLELEAGPGTIGVGLVPWVPSASGPWRLELDETFSRTGRPVEVSAPVIMETLALSRQVVDRGDAVEVTMRLSSSEAVTVHRTRLAVPGFPLDGLLSSQSVVELAPVPPFQLAAGDERQLLLKLTPRASGQLTIVPVLETDAGLIVGAPIEGVSVNGPNAPWLLGATPSLVIGLVILLQVTWRRRWVE